jgi:hypothetical protein
MDLDVGPRLEISRVASQADHVSAHASHFMEFLSPVSTALPAMVTQLLNRTLIVARTVVRGRSQHPAFQ